MHEPNPNKNITSQKNEGVGEEIIDSRHVTEVSDESKQVAHSKSRGLLKNTGILAIGSFSSKILVFLLVPLYTAVLTTEEYGSYDIIFSTVSLLAPLLTLNIADAMMRFPMDEGADVPRIARIGLSVTLASGVVVLAAQLVPGAPWQSLAGIGWLAPLYVSIALYQSLSLLARGLERMKDIAVAGVASSVVLVALSVMLLIFAGWGLDGYFAANVAAMLLPALWLAWRMRREIFAPSHERNKGLLVELVRYSLPISMAAIGWWLIGASDRYIVTAICGIDANGLYSVAYRIPSILSTLSGIFIQAWQVSAIKGFDPRDVDGFLRKTFCAAEAVVVLFCAVLIPLSPVIALVMFAGDFYAAWVYVPPLLVYAALNAMGGMWAPFFSVAYDPAPMAWSTFFGGVANVAAAIPLVMVFGVQGACVSSVIAGFVNWGFRVFRARRHVEVSFGARRSLALYLALCAQAAVMCAGFSVQVWLPVELLFVLGFVFWLRRDLSGLARLLPKLVKRKRGV